ncbi:MAG: penicillin acylase family protein [Polyangiaceae bacterium]
MVGRIRNLGVSVVVVSAGILAVGGAGVACSDTQPAVNATNPPVVDGGAGKKTYSAKIRRTSYGIPHILANSLGDVAFGQGYALAEDHPCELADQVLKVRSERSKFFGAGPGDANVVSDYAYLAIGLYDRAKSALATQSTDAKDLLDGFAAGYNRRIREPGPDGLPPACANAAWVRPISSVDLLATYMDVGIIAGSRQLFGAIVGAHPPGTPAPGFKGTDAAARTIDMKSKSSLASNGWAFGKDRSTTGRGMIVSDPHFPWDGELQLYESQITVPGVVNAYGVSLLGVLGVLIGFNENLGWTHTFTASNLFTVYRLTLPAGDATSYVVDGQTKKMEQKTVAIDVKQADGSVKSSPRTFYSTQYGPVISLSSFEWTDTQAAAVRDANLDDTTMVSAYMRMLKAKNLDEWKQANAEERGNPWANSMYADKEGKAFYVDTARVPNLSDKAIADFNAARTNDFLTATAFRSGAVFLDGSKSTNEWELDPVSKYAITPFAKAPQIERTDFVFNANDSYWLANPAAPIAPVSPLYGLANTERTVRTRMNALLLAETGEFSGSGDDKKFTLKELQDTLLGNQSLTAALLKSAVVDRCRATTSVMVDGETIALGPACDLLAGWNGKLDIAAKGAFVWREFLASRPLAAYFANPFDATQPITTPNGLVAAPATGDDPVLLGLGAAVKRIRDAGFALDATLGSVQYTMKGDERIPMHGGDGPEGIANVTTWSNLNSTILPKLTRTTPVAENSRLTKEGYPINYGSSFIMTVQFTEAGPEGEAVLTYSESGDPRSKHFADQTRLFSEKKFRPIAFKEEDIAKDPELKTTDVTSTAE